MFEDPYTTAEIPRLRRQRHRRTTLPIPVFMTTLTAFAAWAYLALAQLGEAFGPLRYVFVYTGAVLIGLLIGTTSWAWSLARRGRL